MADVAQPKLTREPLPEWGVDELRTLRNALHQLQVADPEYTKANLRVLLERVHRLIQQETSR